jgi:hypothetical protein
VFGGVFDAEFSGPSRRFFDQVRQGRWRLVVSPLVLRELDGAPEEVRRFANALMQEAEIVDIGPAAYGLQDAYLKAGIVTENHVEDALHVAIASVSACFMIVSWNFKHIVHFDKVPGYNAVNTIHRRPTIEIHSPREIIEDENENEII